MESSPWSLDRRGWMKAARGVVAEVTDDHLSLVAGGVAFFAFLSVFPALAALVAGYGLLFDASDVTAQMQQLHGVLPPAALSLLEEQLQRLVDAAPQSLSWGAVLALALALWSANRGSRGIVQAINLAYDQQETRGIVRLNLVGLLLTVGAIAFVLIAVALVAVAPAVLRTTGLAVDAGYWISVLRWPVLVGVVLVALAIVYYVAPDRPEHRWRWLSPGSVLATVLLLAASATFSLYVSRFGEYNEVYGSLGAVAIFLLWLYLVSFVVLLGAELDGVIERVLGRRVRNRTPPPSSPSRRAVTPATSPPAPPR